MIINELSPHPLARTKKRRKGRGIGSGLGKTSGRGMKGAGARSGAGLRTGFEGGQMPLMRRIPKRGFTNNFAKEYSVVNISVLNENFKSGETVTAEILKQKGIISKIEPYGLKILGDGEITAALKVRASAYTKSAQEKIAKAGGSAEIIKAEKKITGGEPVKTAAGSTPAAKVASVDKPTASAAKKTTAKAAPKTKTVTK
jgi:large subunit ribosomal protein L15